MLRFEIPAKLIITVPDSNIDEEEDKMVAVMAIEQKINDLGCIINDDIGEIFVRMHIGEHHL